MSFLTCLSCSYLGRNPEKTGLATFKQTMGGKFISIILEDICNQKRIDIKYTIPFMHKENSIAE